MNVIDAVLATARTADTHHVRIAATAPWGVRFPSRDVARMILVRRGRCMLTGAGLAEPRSLTARSCFLVQANHTFELQDALGQPMIDCDEIAKERHGPTTVGGGGELTQFASVRFSVDQLAANALFDALSPLAEVRLDEAAGHQVESIFALMAAESDADRFGSGLVENRLAEILFVQALRACQADAHRAGGWLAALHEPRLAVAVTAMHDDLARPWTVQELADLAAMSRSSFSALFKRRTGDTPSNYLTTWRMHLAKQLLRETPLSVEQIAAQVGYVTGQSFSRAFAQRECTSPGAWRRTVRTR